MTVAVACLFEWKTEEERPELAVLTAADRMITLAEIEWETNEAKTWAVNRRLHVLVAGAYSTHAMAMNSLKRTEYNEELSVHKFAHIYQEALAEQQREEASRIYLQPLGLTLADLNKDGKVLSARKKFLIKQIQAHPPIDAQALIVGCDNSQGHIYKATADRLECHTEIGWAAIGSGMWLASSEFIRHNYSKHSPYQTALFVTYRAKRVAESASFVGKKTDLIQITRSSFNHINSVVLDTLERANTIYEESVSAGKASALHEIVSSLQPAEVDMPDPLKANPLSAAFPDRQAE